MEWAERVKNCKNLDELQETAKECETIFKDSATKMVFADGKTASKIMFIGLAPEGEADKQGKPFPDESASGMWLNSKLNSISLARGDVYITNTVLWRPRDNWHWHQPKEKIKPFLPILHRHVELVAPKILVCLGKIAANALLATNKGILTLRGEWDEYTTMSGGKVVPVMPTPHPSYVLRHPHEQALAQNDFNLIAEKICELNLTQ